MRMESEIKTKILDLMSQRDSIEREINQLGEILKSQNVEISESLIDNEGFPRNDIDIYSIRHARNRIAFLQTDHKKITQDIENYLHQLHGKVGGSSNETYNLKKPEAHIAPISAASDSDHLVSRKVFAVIDRVDADSPAFNAGVLVGDMIVSFGSVNSTNFTNLKDIGAVVQYSQGKSTAVTIIRNGNVIRLKVVPQTWSGQGLLGCNIQVVEK